MSQKISARKKAMTLQISNNDHDLTLQGAIEIASEEIPGEVVKAKLKRKDHKLIFNVEVIFDDICHTIKVDGRKKKIVKISPTF